MLEKVKPAGKKIVKEALVTGGYMGGVAFLAELANGFHDVRDENLEFALDYSDPLTYPGLLTAALLARFAFFVARAISYSNGRFDRADEEKDKNFPRRKNEPKF